MNRIKQQLIILIVGLTFLLPATSMGQFTNLLVEDFEAGCGQGTLPRCSWAVTDNGGTSRWTVTSGTCVLVGSFSLAVGSDVTYCAYNYAGSTDKIARRQFSSSGFQLLNISFNWKCVGENIGPTIYDYAQLVYSTDNVSWTDVTATKYQGQGGMQTVSNLAIPAAIENDASVWIGWRWIDDFSITNPPGIVVDNIVVEGEQMTPNLPGALSSNSPQCGNVTITRAGAPPSPSNVTWYWQGTSCGMSTLLGSGVNFSAPLSGTYYLRARNTVSGLWSGCRSIAVVIDSPLPTANAGVGGNECDLTYNLSATPSVGVGTWTMTAGTGTASYSPNANDPNAAATATLFGTKTFRWTEVNGACVDFDEITVNFYDQPVASAGAGSNECDLNYTFGASLNVGTGTWTQVSGPGTSSYIPSANSAIATVTATAYGTYTYRWTGVNGTCSDFDDVSIVYAQQPVASAGPNDDECDLFHTLAAVPSVGSGLWTRISGPVGNLVSYFPNAADPNAITTVTLYGTYIFRWTETNGVCSDFDDVIINYYQQPIANAGPDGTACGLPRAHTMVGIPSIGTGTWSLESGPGTVTSYLPSINSVTVQATVDTYGTYTFEWKEVNAVCSDSDLVVITYNALPVVSFSGLTGPYCISETVPIPMTGSPLGGTFSGNGVVGTDFYPNLTVVGNNTITYTYTDGFGCTNSSSQVINIIGLPVVSFTGLSSSYCKDDAVPNVLTGFPAGGAFSGNGIIGTTFTPVVAGAGLHVIRYDYTDGNGCYNFDDQPTVVHPLPLVAFSGLAPAYCEDAAAVTLSGIPSGGTFSGTGITGNSFDPVVAGVGVHSITYSYTDVNGCANDSIQSVTVNALPAVSFIGLNPTYCVSSGPAALTGSPVGGTFSGVGISGDSFFPSVAGIGVHAVTYTFTNGNGCTDTDVQVVTVVLLPVASFVGLPASTCIASATNTLVGTPLGGTFSGPGITGTTFDPAAAGLGTHTIEYLFTDGAGCSDSTSQTVTVHPLPTVTFSGLGAAYCIDDNPVSLTGFPAGGTFNGTGMSGINFDPSVSGQGTFLITYVYTDGNGCSDSSTQSVTVNPLPIVSFSGLNANYCVAAGSVSMTGSPSGGTFSGTGVTGNLFLPSVAGIGSYTVTYTYTDGNGCF
ncbi:MAG: hypothetical protein JKX73_02320, partial [Flavobacteriales bacterium]|nr:hypothetical protein [Flavobacteriales bacterium]